MRTYVQVRFRERVHEGMARGGESIAPISANFLFEENLLVEDIFPSQLERGDGFRAFEFQNVRDKFTKVLRSVFRFRNEIAVSSLPSPMSARGMTFRVFVQ